MMGLTAINIKLGGRLIDTPKVWCLLKSWSLFHQGIPRDWDQNGGRVPMKIRNQKLVGISLSRRNSQHTAMVRIPYDAYRIIVFSKKLLYAFFGITIITVIHISIHETGLIK